MTPEELKKAPKLFCENIKIGQSPEYFVMALSSGAQANIFSLTPEHTKRFLKYLTYEITEYEKVHGEIKTNWTPHVVSPVQRANPPTDAS